MPILLAEALLDDGWTRQERALPYPLWQGEGQHRRSVRFSVHADALRTRLH